MRFMSTCIALFLFGGVLARPVKDTEIDSTGELHFTEDPSKSEAEPDDAQLFFLWDPEPDPAEPSAGAASQSY
ncbi:hypothetical protein BS50DRAFT_680933 [Corynespora cassiicola Philippines]|uniref:Secreted protein n=1 Tax=Corynespora cassiicola Philippines TaxID=1448308 RepID=A0A2T2N835_CORCC|nr:hypothetical protein BS50DRAFT_680933 [Corynespora cassiicola Philippines]